MGKITNFTHNIGKLFLGDSAGESFSTWVSNNFNKRSKKKLLEEYKNLVYQCVTVIAEDVGKYEPIFNRKNKNGELEPFQHEFQEVLDSPNPTTTKYELFEATQSFIELVGNAFWYYELNAATRKPVSIDLIRPDRVKVAIDKSDGSVVGYVVHRDDGIDIPLEADEMEHFKTFNPMDRYYGLGTVEANLLYIDTENYTSQFQANFMKNQATPSGVLTLTGKISREAFQKVKKKWAEQQAGLANVGKTLFIRETEAKFTKVGLSIADIDMKELKDITDKKVRGAFRVPKAMLGDTDAAGLGRDNIESMDFVFAKRVIEPKLNRIDDQLALSVRDRWNDKNVHITHINIIPEDTKAQLVEDKSSANIWQTVNEIREKRGMTKLKTGGDDLYIGFNMIPLSSESGGENSDADKSFGKIKITRKVVAQKDAAEETFFQTLERIEEHTEKQYRSKFKKLLKKQEKQLIALIQAAEGKKSIQKIYDELMPDEQEEAKLFTEALIFLLFAGMENAGSTAIEYLGISDIEFTITQATRDAIFESTQRLMKSFTKETTLKIQKQLADGLLNNESIEQLTKRIESVYKDAAGFRAKRIAITESHKAGNQAVAEAYKQSGIKKMRWQIRDASACEFCRSLDGTVVEIGTSFVPKGGTIQGEDGGEQLNEYDDIKFADAHPNCRCQLIPIRD